MAQVILSVISVVVGILGLSYSVYRDREKLKTDPDRKLGIRTSVVLSLLFLFLVGPIIALATYSTKYFNFYPVPGNEVYEWQWAGENWIGEVTFINDATGMKVFVEENKQVKIVRPDGTAFLSPPVPVIWSTRAGSFSKIKGNGIKIVLPVKKNEFEGERPWPFTVIADSPTIETLEAELYPVKAYAGTVTYINPDRNTKETGRMVLVDDKTRIY